MSVSVSLPHLRVSVSTSLFQSHCPSLGVPLISSCPWRPPGPIDC
jgi:hypothetical protein